jgi:hypothetical protein
MQACLDAGGRTRTPDTRIMIPRDFGLAIGHFACVGHAVGHNCTGSAEPTLTLPWWPAFGPWPYPVRMWREVMGCISATHALLFGGVPWDVFFTARAEEWVLGLDDRDYEAIMAAIELLEEKDRRSAGLPSIASRARGTTT